MATGCLFIRMNYVLLFLVVLCTVVGECSHAQNKRTTDSLDAVLKSMPEDTNRLNTLRALFNEYRYSDFQKAQDVAQQELQLSLKLRNTPGEATAYRHMGIACSGSGNSAIAIDFYLKAIRLYEQLNEQFFVAACYNNMGSVYIDLKQWDKAKKNLNKAIQIWTMVKDGQEGVAIALSNLASVYVAQKQDSLALVNYQRSIQIAQKIDLPEVLCESQTNIAGIYISSKDYATASQYLQKALPVALEIPSNEVLTQIYYYQSKIAMAQNRLDEALGKATQSLSLARQISYSQWIVKCYDQLAKLYALEGRYERVAHFQALYITLNDSLNTAEQTLTVEKLQYDYQLEKKDLMTQSLLKDKKLKEEKIAQDDIKKKGGLALLLVFIATTIFYRIIYQRQKRMNQVMVLQQQEIQGQNEEIKQQNEQMLLQRENLAKANVALNKLFSIISHDLQAPFRAIRGILSLFDDELLDPEEMQDATRKLSERVNKTSELLDNLLHWSKSQLKGFEVHGQPFDVVAVVSKSVGMLEIIASQKQIRLAVETPPALEAYADPDMVDTILRNLISNAIKFSKSNDTVWIRAIDGEAYVSVSVQDEGQGMDTETQQKILNSAGFYSTLGTTGERGTGLGIHLCQEFLTLNGGQLTLASTIGQGSTFTFTLPKAKAA